MEPISTEVIKTYKVKSGNTTIELLESNGVLISAKSYKLSDSLSGVFINLTDSEVKKVIDAIVLYYGK